jgi:hypothetical protein
VERVILVTPRLSYDILNGLLIVLANQVTSQDRAQASSANLLLRAKNEQDATCALLGQS